MDRLLPGARIGVRYATDPNFVHERVLGFPVSKTAWLVLTPHDDEYIEDYGDWAVTFALTGRSGYGDHVTEADDVIAFAEPLDDAVIKEFCLRARRLARVAQRDEPSEYVARPVEPALYVDWDGGQAVLPAEGRVAALRDRTGLGVTKAKRRVTFKSHGSTSPLTAPAKAATPARDAAPSGAGAAIDIPSRGSGGGSMPIALSLAQRGDRVTPADGQIWVVCDPGHGVALGEPVALYRDCLVFGDRGLWVPDKESAARPIPIMRIEESTLSAYVEARETLFGVGCADVTNEGLKADVLRLEEAAVADKKEIAELKAGGSLRARVGLGGTKDGADKPDDAVPTPKTGTVDPAGDDERTLWIDIDEHDEQWKPWRDVVRESFTRGWGKEWDLDGPPSCFEVSRHFDKNGGDPRLWLQLFESEKGIKRSDRLHHELSTLIDTLYYAGSVDQLNLGGLLCLEIVARRLEAIVEALRDGADNANWDTAKYLAGRRSAMDCVSSGLRSWASTQVQNEMRVQSYRTRARGLTGRAADTFEDDGGDDGAAAPSGGRPAAAPNQGKRPRGKGDRGRGRGRM